MAKDASEYLTSFGKSVSSFVPSSFFFQNFGCKAEFLSYLVLCVAKMPFIPPVSIPRSVSGLTGKERSANSSPSSTPVAKARDPREDRGSSVKERLTSNLKQLAKKSRPRSRLPTAAKGAAGAELHAKRRDRPVSSSQADRCPASSSGESPSKTRRQTHVSQSSVRREPEVKRRSRHEEEARFTLTLTPEAVVLLQRRNGERHQRSAARNAEGASGASGPSGAGVCGGAADSGRRRENIPKRHQPATQRHSTAHCGVAVKSTGEAELGDITSVVKISLLNERHKYDDVEYEEEGEFVDERVVLKCTEWLRGLENTPVTAGNSLSKSASSVKSF
ncbi:proline-rich protein 18-like [Scophthalmus maximus]|uniref:proline-rich protein 18-like n=1 Tax=Scophthalmus maximus TaxID=52904 RepID=UPI001FA857BC|nr:proline-rich protein 18-like [Scophthalmus maximus]